MIFEYTVIRSARKSIALQVDENCNIVVRAPLRVSEKDIEHFVYSKKKWLEKTIVSQRRKCSERKNYTNADIDFLRQKAKLIIPQKVEFFSALMGVEPADVKINSAKKRYGSCSAKNSLNFSIYLMDKEERFIDYVVIHELAHIKHHNHSKEFYNFVAEFMPDYKQISKL